MPLASLRRYAFLVPTVLILVFLLAFHLIGPDLAHSLTGALLAAGVISVGTFCFTAWVFGILQGTEAQERKQREQVEALNQASIQILRDLDPGAVLQKVADSARSLLEAEYCALQVMAENGHPATMVTSGMHPQIREGLGDPPRGLGVLGLVRERGGPVRVPVIAAHPASVGFPPGHPPMTSFLGVPIISRGRMLGQLYLSNKRTATEFSAEDEQVAEMLANQAAVAIENARLYEGERRTSAYLQRLISGSHDAMVVLSADGRIRLWNRGAQEIYGWSEAEVLGEVMPMVPAEERARALTDLRQVISSEVVRGHEDLHQHRNGTIVPVLVTFSLVPRELDGDHEIIMIAKETTANRRLEAQRRRLALLEERQRISMDLHDGAIQSLYAVGLGLGATRVLLSDSHAEARASLGTAVDQINGVIRQLRAYITDLRSPAEGPTAAEGLDRLASRLREAAGLEVDVTVRGEVEALPGEVTYQLLHIAGEAASNVVRHARASRVTIDLLVDPAQTIISIGDDGQGFVLDEAMAGEGFGLRNIQMRAEMIGGTLSVHSTMGQGAVVRVRAPLKGEEA